jgi:hypothetical protein
MITPDGWEVDKFMEKARGIGTFISVRAKDFSSD